MKKISCDIIKDVLPLYLDNVVSSATKEMVEEHLSSCDSCRKEAEALKQDVVLPASQNIRLAEARMFKKLKSKFRKKKMAIIMISMVTAAIIMMSLYSFAVLSKKCIPYDKASISIDEAGGKLYAAYRGENLGGTVSLAPSVITIDGEEKNVAAFYYYETLWSKYVQPAISGDGGNAEKQSVFCLGSKGDIDQVYYGEFNLDGSKVDYAAVAKKAALIWGE